MILIRELRFLFFMFGWGEIFLNCRYSLFISLVKEFWVVLIIVFISIGEVEIMILKIKLKNMCLIDFLNLWLVYIVYVVKVVFIC